MAGLEFCSKHNMVAYLEKTDGNTEFHQIMDFLTRSSIYYALTVSPIVSTSFVEQFWTTAKSRTVNNISYIDATVAGKPVTISEASIRSDLLFDDTDGIDSLNNQAIFDNIQLMGEDQPQTQTDPSPRLSPSIAIPDSNPEGSGGNHGGQSSNDISLSGNEDGLGQEAKERSQTTSHTSQILDEECCTEDKISKKDFSEEKGAFDDLDDIVDDTMDYIESEDAQDEGRTSFVVLKEKESADNEVNTEAPVSTVKPNKGTDKRNEGTGKQDGGTDSTKVSTDRQGEGTADKDEGKNVTQTAPTPTPTVFGDDETIAQVLIIMSQNKEKLKEKEKGVEIRNVEETERPRPTSTRSILTLRPLPKIDPKDKGKKRIEEEDESDTESEGITEAEKKFKQLANDEEVARKVQEEWEAEEEKKRLAEEEATKAALSNEYDFIQARLNADKILAEKLQEEEREMYTIEQRTKFLHDTIAAQRRFLAQQRSEAIRNKPPSRNQLRNQMMTYLKHVGGKKHSDLKTKSFDEIQVLYEKIKRSDDSFIAIGSAEDEKVIKEMNEQAADASKKRVKKDDSVKGEIKEEEGTRKRKSGHVKMIARKRPRPQPDDDSDDEHRKCLRIVTFEGTIDSEIMETKSFIARLHKSLRMGQSSTCKELLQQMIDLGLEVKEESIAALQLGSQLTLLHSKELASPGSNSSCKTIQQKSSSSKGTKSQLKSFGKSVQAEEPEFETLQQGPTQSWLMTLASTADKLSKTFDELMSTPIDFSMYIMNSLKITNLSQETLLGPAFKLLKGTRTNFVGPTSTLL
ncbi:hypothetical protein Tco_0878333 [Tanacetum coccineum]|uniref:Uncharacterized protein n=1 Tax=Tanacetum coccineum TaxID=301880 RepID=A0ABQ5C026_9ASTR